MNNIVKGIVAFFVVAGMIFVSYQIVNQWHRKQLIAALNNQSEEYKQQIAKLNATISEQKAKLAEMEQTKAEMEVEPPQEAIENIFGEKTQVTALGNHDAADCTDLSQQAKALFDHIDQQGYLAEGGFQTKFLPFFQESMQLLAKSPPVLVAEMDDLYVLSKNVSHLYRILGLKRLKVFKHIIEKENEVLEPAMAVFYGWFTACRKSESAPAALPTLKTMYEYAGFFLNTLGGRSYLLRRDSKIRILVNYYSVLIMDLANDEKLNSVGFDIRKSIDALQSDLTGRKGLVYRDRYLAKLKALQAKYQQAQ